MSENEEKKNENEWKWKSSFLASIFQYFWLLYNLVDFVVADADFDEAEGFIKHPLGPVHFTIRLKKLLQFLKNNIITLWATTIDRGENR